MTTSSDNLQPGQLPASSASKPLWAAIGILGVAVLGMATTMIYNQRAQVPASTVAAVTTPQAMAAPQLAAPTSTADDLIEKPEETPARLAPVPAKKVINPAYKVAPAPSYLGASSTPEAAAYPAPAMAAAPICAVCGTVESVMPVERSAKPAGPGVGAVAGGVIGGLLGNQMGHGGGRAAATLLGAVGGGFAGNAIEGQMRKEIVYRVRVRMEDGSRRTVEVRRAPSVGSRVTLKGATLHTNDGAIYGPKTQ